MPYTQEGKMYITLQKILICLELCFMVTSLGVKWKSKTLDQVTLSPEGLKTDLGCVIKAIGASVHFIQQS